MKKLIKMYLEWRKEDFAGTKKTSKQEQLRRQILAPFVRVGGSNLWGKREEW